MGTEHDQSPRARRGTGGHHTTTLPSRPARRTTRLTTMKALNDVVRLTLELAALAGFGMYASHSTVGASRRIATGAAVLGAATFWGWFMAPRSLHRLGDPTRLLVEIAYFAGAFLGLSATQRPTLAITLAAVAAVNIPLDRLLVAS